ncbi:MAG: CBS domain-containing protein [Oscillospiraceae bacterium]
MRPQKWKISNCCFHKEVADIELSKRQKEIIEIIKTGGVVTAEKISEKFYLSKATLRPDLAVLTRAGIISAKPRVGYCYNEDTGSTDEDKDIAFDIVKSLSSFLIGDWMGVPAVIPPSVSAFDASAELFMRDVGSLFINDEDDGLVGIVSRKDLLRVAIGKADLHTIPITMIMTRKPNIIFIYEHESLYHAAKLMKLHEIDSLPVVEWTEKDGKNVLKVIGRITKTTIVKAFVSMGE